MSRIARLATIALVSIATLLPEAHAAAGGGGGGVTTVTPGFFGNRSVDRTVTPGFYGNASTGRSGGNGRVQPRNRRGNGNTRGNLGGILGREKRQTRVNARGSSSGGAGTRPHSPPAQEPRDMRRR